MHAYPTYSDGVWNAAIAEVQDSLRSPLISRGVQLLGRVRRSWLDGRRRIGG